MVTKTSLLKQMEDLIEEPGLTCCICREGYKFQVHFPSRMTGGHVEIERMYLKGQEIQLKKTWIHN